MPVGLVMSGLLAGGIIAGTQVAGAETSSSSSTSVADAPAHGDVDGDPATMEHGPDETLLTGDTAQRVEDAALEEVPGATVIRVETDAHGDAYEAHLQEEDGSYVTVKLDEDFDVTGTEEGFGGGPHPGSWDGTGH